MAACPIVGNVGVTIKTQHSGAKREHGNYAN